MRREEEIEKEKQMLREKIWKSFLEKGIASFPPPFGRIPNFIGVSKTAEILRQLKEYQRAEVIFCSPDSPQRPIREVALKDGKVLIMATPRLRKGFIMIRPEDVKGLERLASTIRGAFKFGKTVSTVTVDLAVIGSVAVDLEGNRLGKGGGYGDIEIETITKGNPSVIVATNVHPIQIVEIVPASEHDKKVDLVITLDRAIWTRWGRLKHHIE